ncbi:MAG: nucleotidyltransferase family protein [Ruminococcaceae bacterium]|nr:nucleotidyltransferase family protein [Oscillospiraceae bacterium]
MSRICIVCEFNPLHNGHVYLLNKAKELGAQSITCIMSGNATQRGELSIVDKYARAEAAVISGADLVLELPYPWCTSSAEYFATAAVSLVYPFGDTLLFGSECGDIELLKRAAVICDTTEFKAEYEARVSDGEATAAAYLSCLRSRGIDTLSSNDLLGVAYIRAINKLGVSLTPMTVKRCGAEYNETNEVEGELQSATALRSLIAKGEIEKTGRYTPESMCDKLREARENGRLTDIQRIDTAMLAFFRMVDPTALSDIAEMTDGLENRICSLANASVTFEQAFEAMRTKRYTDAKLRRAVLFALTGVRKSDIRSMPEYTLLLGANETGRVLLADNRKAKRVNVVTKPADAPKETVQYALCAKLDALYGLARENAQTTDAFIKSGAYIHK